MTTGDYMQMWLDKLALTELLAVLSAAVDRGDRDAIIGCYAEESYDDHGAFKGSGREFAEMICAPMNPGRQMTMHHLLGQSVFAIDADDAWGETFFVMHAVISGRTMTSFGRYIDYFRRIDDSWKLAYRRVVPDATLPGDDADYWAPSRDRSDPRYDKLTKPPAD
jgi:SnoaL-like domain